MNPKQLRETIIKPVLKYLEPEIPYSEHAVELLMMTAAHESILGYYLHQVGGPANGIYQMEPPTEVDIWENFLEYNSDLADKIRNLTLVTLVDEELEANELCANLYYATAMARAHYYRDSEALPVGSLSDESTIRALAAYAKRVWNTEDGKATVDDYFNAYTRRCLN